MAVIRPFKALRPAPEAAERVASVPYDVVNRQEAAEKAKDSSVSFLRITRSEIELPESVNPYSPEVYKKAKENIERITKEAPLVTDDEPRLYLYQLEMDGRKQTGLAATFSVDEYDNDIILKHEKTRKVKEDDRTNHIINTDAQTGVVFLTCRGVDKVKEITKAVKANQTPTYDFTAPDGIKHTVWIVPVEMNNDIIEAIGGVQNLYIADGHHRAKSASRAREEKKNNNAAHSGEEEYNYFIAALFPAEELKILAYNRAVKTLNGRSKEEFLEAVKENFDVEAGGEKEPAERRKMSMYLDGSWYRISLKEKFFENGKLKNAKTVGETLDVSILQNYLLQPLLGIDDPRTSDDIDFIGGIRGTKELEKLVNGGSHAVAFSMYPVTVEELMQISDAGEVMPPKSTWFEPKLRDGLLTHLI